MNPTVVVDEKWGIGKDGGLLTHLPEDMRYFREMTRGKTVAMGCRTLGNFPGGKPLKNHVNMALSRDEACAPEGTRVYHSVEGVLEALGDYREEDVLIIDGGIVHREFLPCYSKAYVTYIHHVFDVGTAFENLDQDENWKLKPVSDGKEHGGISSEFRVYRRIRWGDVESLRNSGRALGH